MGKAKLKRVRGTYGKPWSQLTKIPVSEELLHEVGKVTVSVFAAEATKDFAKRKWSMRDPMGGPPLKDSFDYYIEGKSTVVVTSSFYGVAELAQGDIPERRMDWLTQEGKERNPSRYKMTDAERRQKAAKKAAAARKAKAGIKMKAKDRAPLVVPIKDKTGQVVFRMAPLKVGNSWVHPGIAKFTFAQRAIRKAKKECWELVRQSVIDTLMEGDPTQ